MNERMFAASLACFVCALVLVGIGWYWGYASHAWLAQEALTCH